MSTKAELLKLKKSELIKKCKQYKVYSTRLENSKSDMIDRLLNNNQYCVEHEIKTSPKKTKTSKTIKNKTNKTKKSKKSKTSEAKINKEYFYLFKPLATTQVTCDEFRNTFEINELLHSFMDFLPIYTMSNFISAFPKYSTYYKTSNIIKTVIDNDKQLNIGHRKRGRERQAIRNTGKRKKKVSNSILSTLEKRSKPEKGKPSLKLLADDVSERIGMYGLKKKKSLIAFGKEYKHGVTFNKTKIFSIDHLLKLFKGIALS
eukprot:209999_1